MVLRRPVAEELPGHDLDVRKLPTTFYGFIRRAVVVHDHFWEARQRAQRALDLGRSVPSDQHGVDLVNAHRRLRSPRNVASDRAERAHGAPDATAAGRSLRSTGRSNGKVSSRTRGSVSADAMNSRRSLSSMVLILNV